MNFPFLQDLINIALKEDIGDGDHSALACLPQNEKGKAKIIAKEKGIISGIFIAELVFYSVDPAIKLLNTKKDGAPVNVGDIVMEIEGPRNSILSAERTVLNFLQRLSGVSTITRKYADLISGTKTQVLDTRKTTPGWRHLEKWAVTMGGGANHRMGLYDMVMLKDNHIDFAGGIPQAVEKTHAYLKSLGKNLPIEVEVRNLKELDDVLNTKGIQRVMLDNFSVEDTRIALARIDGKLETESSGGINDKTILAYAESGVDFISVGALTHSVKSLDLSLIAD